MKNFPNRPIVQHAVPPLWLPSDIRIEMTVHLCGTDRLTTVGWKVTDHLSDELLCLGSDNPRPHGEGRTLARRRLQDLIEQSEALLSPF